MLRSDKKTVDLFRIPSVLILVRKTGVRWSVLVDDSLKDLIATVRNWITESLDTSTHNTVKANQPMGENKSIYKNEETFHYTRQSTLPLLHTQGATC